MLDYCYKKTHKLEAEIKEILIELDNPIELAASAIGVTLKHLKELKDYILIRNFDDIEEEIYFLKSLNLILFQN